MRNKPRFENAPSSKPEDGKIKVIGVKRDGKWETFRFDVPSGGYDKAKQSLEKQLSEGKIEDFSLIDEK